MSPIPINSFQKKFGNVQSKDFEMIFGNLTSPTFSKQISKQISSVINPMGPERFFDACVPGGVLFHNPFQNNSLLQKIIFFVHGQILATF